MAVKDKPNEEEIAQDIKTRRDSTLKVRQDYEPLWQDIVDFVNIRRYNFKGTKQPGIKVGTQVYDSSPLSALRDLADGLFGYLIAPSVQWFKLRVPIEEAMELDEVRAWLEIGEHALYAAFQRSNFYEVMPEYFQDGASIGTATLYSEEDRQRIKTMFTCCHPGEITISENKYGKVDTHYRTFNLTARQAVQHFEKTLLSDAIQKAYDTKAWDELFPFIHECRPNDDIEYYFDNQTKNFAPKIGPKNKPFLSRYIEDGGKKLVRESGYYSSPFASWRWRKNSDEVYGRSPAADAIIDVLTSNQMKKTLLNAGQISVEPPLNVPKELKGQVRYYPRGENLYEKADRKVEAVNPGIDYPIGADREKVVDEAIKKHFMVEFFTLLSRAALEGRPLTVPQVMEMQGEKAVMLGTIVGHITSECLDPVIDRMWNIEVEAKRIPPAPQVLLKYMHAPVQVDYMGPLAQAQRRLFKTQSIFQALESLVPVIKIHGAQPDQVENPVDNIDLDAATIEILEATNAPTKIIRPTKKRDAKRKARKQAQAGAQKMAAMQQMADMVPKVTGPVDASSPVMQMLKENGANVPGETIVPGSNPLIQNAQAQGM